MRQYHELLERIMSDGVRRSNRTGVDAVSIFGHQSRYNLAEGFPLLATKRLPFKAIVCELLWFIRGWTNVGYLRSNGVTIWDEWADENGDLGPVYGKQWRSWETPSGESIDQLRKVVGEIASNPDSRRLLVSAWNVADLDRMALAPCHVLFQFNVSGGRLSCQMYQRSADAFLGVPFNIASYALLTMIVAKACRLNPGEFIHTIGDAHIYVNHLQAADLLLSRSGSVPKENRPEVKIRLDRNADPFASILDIVIGDITLEGYHPLPSIKAEVAV